jgi:hypothetical protein
MKPQPELRSRVCLGNATAQLTATSNATAAQPMSLKALAAGILARNQERNSSATVVEKGATDAQPDRVAVGSPVMKLRLTVRLEDGGFCEVDLLVPKERYDGLRVLELFEKHMALGTSVVSVHTQGLS